MRMWCIIDWIEIAYCAGTFKSLAVSKKKFNLSNPNEERQHLCFKSKFQEMKLFGEDKDKPKKLLMAFICDLKNNEKMRTK